jgi:phosphopentomutase
VGGLRLPHLAKLGLGNILPVEGVPPAAAPGGCFGRLAECSPGKDSSTGHWELAGVVLNRPFPTYPHGFPPDIIRAFEVAIGRGTLGNKAASGTEIVQELGDEHLATGKPIVYTSVDSVFQIAAHEDVLTLEELYTMCEQARALLRGDHNVARVIARPFTGTSGGFRRINGARKDFAVQPSGKTLLDILHRAGVPVAAVGKILDLFAGRGIDHHRHSGSNAETLDGILAYLGELPRGLIMANLVDFDMLYGHRKDAAGYAEALRAFDGALPALRQALRAGDVCLITSDHGCDPTTAGTDHTREYALLLAFGAPLRRGVDLGVRTSFADCGATLADMLGVERPASGASFAQEVLR